MLPGPPVAQRLLSIVAAVPLYHVLPVYRFTNLPDVDPSYLRAVEALAMLSYLAILATSILAYAIVRRRLEGSAAAGVIAALATFCLLQLSGHLGVDPVGILLVALAVFFLERPAVFAGLVLLSIGVNEKVSLVFAILTVTRWGVIRRRSAAPPAVASVVAVLGYLTLRWFSGSLGEVGLAQGGLDGLLSFKRAVLDGIPVVTLLLLYGLALRENRIRSGGYAPTFAASDISALAGVVLVALAVGIRLNIGRIAMFCLPLYLPLAAIALERWLDAQRDPN